MKIRNLAFCGVMASILGVSGAYATDATIIASKAYVDARDNTKQDTANIVTETWANSTADHSSPTKYPSMKTLESAVGAGTSALDGANADSSTGVSAGAAADDSKKGMPVVKVTETDGIVTAELGAIDTAGIKNSAVTAAKLATDAVETNKIKNDAVTTDKIADGAVTAAKLATDAVETNKIKDGAVTTDKIANGNVTMPKTDFVVQQGTSEKDWANADANSENTDEKALATAKTNGDKYVPTVAAVEKRIKQATDAISSGAETGNVVTSAHTDYITKVSAIQAGIAKQGDSTANWNTVTAGTAGTSSHLVDANAAKDSYIPTVTAVEKRVTDETSNMTDSTASATYDSTNGITIATAGGAGNQSKFATSAAVASTANALKDAIAATNTTVADLDLAEVKEAGKPIVAVKQEDGKVGASLGTISYSAGLDYKLSEINTTNDDGSSNCQVGSPCVLTMVMDNGTPVYEWTNMDTDGLDGVL